MADYPTLSQVPDADSFKLEPVVDPTLRSEKENGLIVTRARFTAAKKKWSFKYAHLSTTDKNLLETFEYSTVNFGSLSFNWTNPADSTAYVVRLSQPIRYEYVDNNNGDWAVYVSLEQV